MHTLSIISAAIALFCFAGAASYEKRAGNSKVAVTIKGNAFFVGNKRFYIRGLDVQPGGDSKLADPLARETTCKRDIQEFKKLGINAIRVYTVDNTANHDTCMQLLAEAGIYVAVDLNSPKYSLNRENAYTVYRSYNDVYLRNAFATVDAFANYTNTLLFFAANEVINDAETSFAAPYIKAVTRDVKAYIKARKYRAIPVGYSAADYSDNRYDQATFMNCGGDDARGDFFAFNDYSYCNTDFQKAGWDKKVDQYKSYGIPIFMSEFGCNHNRPRQFKEVADMYSTKMTRVYSGGFVYEYSQESNDYGIVKITGDSVQELSEFSMLADAFKKTQDPQGDGEYQANVVASECPPTDTKYWNVKNNTIPAMPEGAKTYLQNGAGNGPGLKDDDKGSQWAGSPSGSWETPGSSGPSSPSKAKSAGTIVAIPGLITIMTGAVLCLIL